MVLVYIQTAQRLRATLLKSKLKWSYIAKMLISRTIKFVINNLENTHQFGTLFEYYACIMNY